MTDRVPVPRALLLRLWFALGAGALFMIAAVIQGVVRPGYDPWHQAVSALSLGPGGCVQSLNFVMFGVAVLSTVPNWRRILAGGAAASAYPVLTALLGLSFAAVAFVPQDPAPDTTPKDCRYRHQARSGWSILASRVLLPRVPWRASL